MKPTPLRSTLLAVLALQSIAVALPPDVPDPYGIVIKPIPEKLVVLTFDDSVASHATVAAPLMKKLGFGGSFFICDFDGFKTRKDWYLKDNQYTVISLRDLANYVDVRKAARFLPHPSDLPWGGMTRDGKQLYVSFRLLPADRKLTLPGMTTRISRVCFVEDPKKQPLTVITADTGIQTIVVPDSPFVLTGLYPTVMVAELKGDPVATILEFGIPGTPDGEISGNEIRLKVPLAADLSNLAPTYDTGSPLVKGEPASGSSVNFTRPQTYTITAPDESSRTYRVTVTPTQGAVAVSNPDFERFEVLEEQNATQTENPMGVAWSFNKKDNNGEIGIKDLIASPSAPPSPNGSRHIVYIRGAGNSISQQIVFDQGNYTFSFDAVKRNGYERTAAPLIVTIDGAPVFVLDSSKITEMWSSYVSPAFPVTAGSHLLALSLGAGDGMDIIDNVELHYCNQAVRPK
jgi:hypothetical protein